MKQKVRVSKLLREEVEQYTKLTGEDGWHVPIMKVGAYLDGYNKGLEMLDKIRTEIEELDGEWISFWDVVEIIDKYREESER